MYSGRSSIASLTLGGGSRQHVVCCSYIVLFVTQYTISPLSESLSLPENITHGPRVSVKTSLVSAGAVAEKNPGVVPNYRYHAHAVQE